MEQPANTVHESTSNTAVSHNQPAGCVSPSGSLCGTPSSYGTRTRRISKVHKKNERGETPLHVAARRGEHRQCKKLLQNGALVNAADYAGWTPLHEACSHGNMKAARILINAGADINNACLGTLDTPLHDAVMNGHEKLVWLLLSFGADRERRNGQGKRPLDLCPPESDTLRQLLTSSVVPEHCPSGGESPPSSPLSCQLYHSDTTTTDAPPISSTASSFYDSQSRSELPTDRISPSSSKESPVEADSTLETTPKRKTTDESKETPLCSRRSIWQKDDSYESTTKFDGRTESQAYDVDEGAVREPVSRLGIPSEWEGNEGESRRGGGTMKNRALSTRRDRFTSQPLRRNTLVVGPERRKQRGKRRGRGGASLSTTIPSESQSSATPTTDVYEFRSSPESDVDLTKTLSDSIGDGRMSPSTKRQRLAHLSPSPVTKDNETQQFTNDVVGTESEINDTSHQSCPSPIDGADDKTDGAPGRKVPPLRISLTHTSSEEGNSAICGIEENLSASTSVGICKRNSKNTKNNGKIGAKGSDDGLKGHDEGSQRMTRSKFRQYGQQLRGQGYETNKLRKGELKRSATSASIVNLSTTFTPNAQMDELSTHSAEQAVEKPGEDLTELSDEDKKTGTVVEEDNSTAMNLMQRNTYEGFRGLRAMIVNRWSIAAEQPPAVPAELTPNYPNYMIVKGNFTVGQKDPCPQPSIDSRLHGLPASLQKLFTEQTERRHEMEVAHKIEKERLQMLAESEVIRYLKRKANPSSDFLSAIRVLHESEVFNTWYLEIPLPERKILGIDEVRAKFDRLARFMFNRQKMEVDSLYAEQVHTWKCALQRTGTAPTFEMEKLVERVPVTALILDL